MGVVFSGELFYGLAFEEPARLPWHRSEDFDPDEDSAARLARRLPMSEHGAAEVEGVELGGHLHHDRPMYLVRVAESSAGADHVYAESFTPAEVQPDWESRVRAYCAVMDIPCEAPGWCLVVESG